jgi:CRP-like cAMP-binding protein
MHTSDTALDQLLTRLGHAKLGRTEQEALLGTVTGMRTFHRGESIVEPGQHPQHLHVISRGWAARVKELQDGSRQITDLLIAGDICDLSALGRGAMDRVSAITVAKVTLLDRSRLLEAIATHPQLGSAIFSLALNEQSILRSWLVCLGQQDRTEHLAHLLCELQYRLRRVGLVGDHTFDLPLTQEDLGNALGMTPVHTNRLLQRMRKEGLISLAARHMEILEPAKLCDIAEFNSAYLAT